MNDNVESEIKMRVIAGTARRLNLKTPLGMETRPTTDRIKETLFNMINPYIIGTNFLDLFAGSGQMGIEALSRGAKTAVFVENNKGAVSCIKENLESTKLDKGAHVISTDVMSALRQLEGKYVFDYIFMDPPYKNGLEKEALIYLNSSGLINEDSVIIIEAALDTAFDYLEDLGYELIKRKQYKTNMHMFVRLNS